MKNKFFSLVILIMSACLLNADSFAQCGAVNFEISSVGTVQTTHAYRAILDFNVDGKPDFAGDSDNPAPQTNDVSILQNNGAGGFTTIMMTVSNSSGGSFYGGDWADFNADGKPDMLGYFSSQPYQVIFYNNGNGALIFGKVLTFDTPFEYVAQSDDINGDGRLDFITAGAPNPAGTGGDEPTYSLYLSTGDGTYAPRRHIITEHANLFTGDFNGDGKKDIAVVKFVSNSNEFTLRYQLQNANGTFGETPEINIGEFLPHGVDDFNRDGKADFYGSTSFNTMAFSVSNPSNSFTVRNYEQTYMEGSFHIYLGDFNGDGKPDALDSGRANDATYGYSIFFGDGAGGFNPYTNAFPLHDQNFNEVAQALEFTGDNRTDLIRFTADFAANRTKIELLKSVCQTNGQMKTVDFDGDGKTDMAFWNPATGKWSIKSSLQPNAEPRIVFFGSGSLGDVPAVGDYDGDGKSDVAVYRNSTGVWYVLRSSDNSMFAVQFGANGDKPVAADYDGDGKSDIAVFRESEGNWYILQSRNGQFQGLHFGQRGDKPVQSDFDGDNRADIAVYRPAQGNWYYLKSSDNQFAAFNFGASTDKPIPADYDGDGKSDIAVFRPSDGTWYVRQSGNQSMFAARWGANGDVPTAFDADGDGKFEFNVYRPTAKVWYLFPSTATAFGADGDLPISIN